MVYIIIAGVIFAADTFIKAIVEAWGKEHGRTPIFKDKLYITKYHNKGAFLNFMESREKLVQMFSICLTLICTMFFIVTLTRKGSALLKTGLSLLLGGAFSNTYDRLSRKYVVDYFGFISKSDRISNVVYNISDFFIAIGALICIFDACQG